MTDLTKGIIEIDGFTLTPKTTLDEMVAYFEGRSRILNLSTGPRLKFSAPYYVAQDIYAYGFDFNDNKRIVQFSLIPAPPPEITDPVDIAKAKVVIAKEWLGSRIEINTCNVNEMGEMGASYSFPWGHISAVCRPDRDYGMVGGEIVIVYRW